MKLFMEINPTLFDECTNEYTAIQEAAPQRLLERENVWKVLEEKAALKRRSLEAAKEKKGTTNIDSDVRAGSPMEITEDVSTDTKKQMDALRLQDECQKKVVS